MGTRKKKRQGQPGLSTVVLRRGKPYGVGGGQLLPHKIGELSEPHASWVTWNIRIVRREQTQRTSGNSHLGRKRKANNKKVRMANERGEKNH